jgi:hypothetical protein
MEKNDSIRAINERLARKIRREGQADPMSPYANRFVGLANGKVVVIADSLTEMHRQLLKTGPDPLKRYGVDVAADYSRVEEVWGSIGCRPSSGRCEIGAPPSS